eukprot:m.43127 g.43127  ORF g.43127 m.43127 type:complete len:55 (+) comp6134_c0_seq3:137-301(+)
MSGPEDTFADLYEGLDVAVQEPPEQVQPEMGCAARACRGSGGRQSTAAEAEAGP